MKRYCCFIAFMVITLGGRAQVSSLNANGYRDSLLNLLKVSKSDSAKTRVSFQLFDQYVNDDTTTAIKYLNLAKKLAQNNAYLKALSVCYRVRLIDIINPSQMKQACTEADKALGPFKSKEAFLFRSRVWFSYASTLQEKDDYEEMTKTVINKSIPYAQMSGDSLFLSYNYTTIALICMNHKDYIKAEKYYTIALGILNRNNARPVLRINTYSFAARNYLYLGKTAAARRLLDKIKPLIDAFPDSYYDFEYYVDQVMYYNSIKQYALSHKYANVGISLAKKLNKPDKLLDFQCQLYETYYAEGKYTNARDILLEILQTNTPTESVNRLKYYRDLSETYEHLNNYPNAYKWLKTAEHLNDSINKVAVNKTIASLEIKYRNAENQKKIAGLETEKQLAVVKAKDQKLTNLILTFSTIFLLITSLFLIYYYRSNRKLAKQKELNYQQQLREAEQQQKLTFTEALLTGEEQERRRVARDLHDSLGGMLSGIKIKLSGQAKADGNQNLDGVILQLDHSVSELRRIARNMMPESLLKLGLETALLDLCESLMSDQTEIKFQAYGISKEMPAIIQANIYRIVQETLSNAIRYAQASKIILQCSQNDDIFLITVEDDGKGFDTAAALKAGGMGFSNIKSRVDYMKGKMDIESVINEGTSINIELNVSG